MFDNDQKLDLIFEGIEKTYGKVGGDHFITGFLTGIQLADLSTKAAAEVLMTFKEGKAVPLEVRLSLDQIGAVTRSSAENILEVWDKA